jgi:hypothetical protein
MDSFEQVVSEILWMQGHWVRSSVKVNLTPAEKRDIGRPSSPRWELDIVAYQGGTNTLRVVECKSYIDSIGVRATGFDGSNVNDQSRYKLFNDETLRNVVFRRLSLQLSERGACQLNPTVLLCLAAGKLRDRDRGWLREHFKNKGWELWDETWLREQLEHMSTQGYENQVSAVVAKLLLRRNLDP